MSARLSDERVERAHDSGHRSLKWRVSAPSGMLSGVDIDALAADRNVKKIVPILPAQSLYIAAKQKGFSESLAVLKHISTDQMTRMLDYDAWRRDQLDAERALQFIEQFGRVSLEHLYERFTSLDEEYQVAILNGLIEAFEFKDPLDIPEHLADSLITMPCQRVYYRVLSDSENVQRAIRTIVDAAMECNMRYAYALISHASYRPPHEDAAQALRFRNARLEEDGFVSYEQSQSIFKQADLLELKQRWSSESGDDNRVVGALANEGKGTNQAYLDQVLSLALTKGWELDELYSIHQKLLYLANALCTAMQVEPDDLDGLNRVLLQAQSMVSVGLDCLSRGNHDQALEILKVEYPKTLFQFGLGLFAEGRKKVSQLAVEFSLPAHQEFKRAVDGMQWGRCLLIIDRYWASLIGFEDAETLKGLFNRVPMLACQLESDEKRIEYVPVLSVTSLDQLLADVSGILGMLSLAHLAGVRDFATSLEVSLNTATLNFLVAGSFDAKTLNRSALDRLSSSSIEQAKERFEALKKILTDHLISSLDSWALVKKQHCRWVVELVLKRFDASLEGLLMAQQQGHGVDNFIIG